MPAEIAVAAFDCQANGEGGGSGRFLWRRTRRTWIGAQGTRCLCASVCCKGRQRVWRLAATSPA